MPSRLQSLTPSIPPFLMAPIRGLKEERLVQPSDLIIPDLKQEAFSIPNAKYAPASSPVSRNNIQTVFQRLREAGESVLSNDDAFKVISFQITNPANYDQYHELVNVGTERAIQSGNFRPGYVQKLAIQKDDALAEVNEVLKNKISFGDKTFILELEGFDLIILSFDEETQIPALELVPTFRIGEEPSINMRNLRIGFDTLENGETVFVDSVELNDPKYRVGVAFLRPSGNSICRENPVWFTPADIETFENSN